MENGEKLTGDDHTSRGLEYRTQEGAWARYENKRDAYNAVLDEQDRQWKEDIDDWDKISAVYLEHSTKCLKAAYERGVKDQQDIAEYIQTVEKKIKKKKKSSSSKDKEKVKDSKKKKAERSKSTSGLPSTSSRRKEKEGQDDEKDGEKKRSKSLKEKRQSV